LTGLSLGEDFVGGLGPHEGLAPIIPAVDEDLDGVDEFFDAGEGAATYGWYWAVDALQAGGASVHLAHPLGVKAFEYRRVKKMFSTLRTWPICCGWGACPRR
jgi:hypothetical protein